MSGRMLAVLAGSAALAVSVVAPGSASAAGAQYHVLKCHYGFNSWSASEGFYESNGGNYQETPFCENSAFRYTGVRTTGGNNNGLVAQWRMPAPPYGAIVGVTASVNLRRETGHRAQFGYWDQVGGFHVLDGVDAPGAGFKAAVHYPNLNASGVGVRVVCFDTCPRPDPNDAHAYIREIEIIAADLSDPEITSATGGLVTEGVWLRGVQPLTAAANDAGSGLEVFGVSLNGAPLATTYGSCPHAITGSFSRRLVACWSDAQVNKDFDTTDPIFGFRDGINAIELTAEDFAGNRQSLSRTVRIDNAPPELAFANGQDPDDPELIRVPLSDAHSGVADARLHLRPAGASEWQPLRTDVVGGEARTRVDSLAYPEGEYEFMAAAGDVAGNAAQTTLRRDGSPMRLLFPLRNRVELRATVGRGASRSQTLRYGTSTEARGRLLNRSGEPLADKRITVIEHFGQGALIRERVSEVTTDAEGRWESKVPAGPSRRVEALFAGTPRYVPAATEAGRLTVNSRASFRTSAREAPEGSRVAFKGKVRHVGARIPAGGKLVELQVRVAARSWDTVGEAFRTRGNGRYRTSYRFGRHYTADVRFRFRIKVQSEGDWPYRRAVSKQRTVTIQAR